MGADSPTRIDPEPAPIEALTEFEAGAQLEARAQVAPPQTQDQAEVAQTCRSASLIARLGRRTLDLLLPATCRLCDRCVPSNRDFCTACRLQLESSENLMQFACLRCGRPGSGSSAVGRPAAFPDGETDQTGCPQCRRETFPFDLCIGLWTYDGLVRQAIVAAKYGSQIALADAMGRRLAHRIRDLIEGSASSASATAADRPDVVTSVPSHFWRRMQRGGGGSRVLARSVARTLRHDWPGLGLADLLATTRTIKKQAWLGEKERVANVRGAFRASRRFWEPPSPARLRDKHVLLIDDVMTTGATAAENSAVLKQAGARRVTVAVVARACSG